MSMNIVWFATTLLLLSHAPFYTLQQEEQPILTDCYNSDNYTSNSQFQANLISSLLPSVASNVNLDTYYNDTVGHGPDRVFGFAQCMSKPTMRDCRDCLKLAVSAIVRGCPGRKQALVRYYNCTLRYSNQSFLSQLDRRLVVTAWPVVNVTGPPLFNKQMEDLMSNLSVTAALDGPGFAVGSTKYSDFDNVYGLAQCTRDLSNNDCYVCLQEAVDYIPTCCKDKQGGNVYFGSCNIRYESYPFYPAFGFAAQPSQPSLPPAPDARFDSSPGEQEAGTPNDRRRSIIIGVTVASISALIITSCLLWVARKKSIRGTRGSRKREDIEDSKPLLFDLSEIRAATNNFSDANKLGQGGFGPVYKGTLWDGREIAVKRLLATSSQGITELRNEIALVAKLQHRNLVKMLGCCLEEQEKLLVYEFVPNTSLEKFIFDPVKCALLTWEIRYKIIGGIARGLLYLHEDSRFRIIHRDLKASNILLDTEMSPKISDFGLAKIFGADQTQGNTSRIAGTFGYMAPEYAMHGLFSTRSDVFSFGVLVLEIVTGQKNSGFNESESAIDLLTHAWKHWTKGSFSELIDESLGEASARNEVLRCIHIGLLCVQEAAMERPTMSTVVLMLSSHSLTLPTPSPPAFVGYRSRSRSNTLGREAMSPMDVPSDSTSTGTLNSVNEASMTEPYPR